MNAAESRTALSRSHVSNPQRGIPPGVWSILLIVAGVLAFLMPSLAALATVLVCAWILVLAGAFEIAFAIRRRGYNGVGWKLGAGILTLLLGVAVVVVPATGIVTLALLVGAFLLVGGATRVSLAWHLRPGRAWRWVMFDGLISIILSVLIVFDWPASSPTTIGLLTGLYLLVAGVWRIVLARTASTQSGASRL